ncbi:glycosyl hydrolase [uncultured Polaribacter sp.]|uniref:glycosyl hydrolase n=1 Tax=uncultured Polaribacter sp. TaxID=174711 RepID=UPI00260DDF98|nr:glycosyl hydrolase [uncultured Polaribacter sp.]
MIAHTFFKHKKIFGNFKVLAVFLFFSINSILAQIDKNATAETKNLYHNLKSLAKNKLIFGHHNTVGMGIGWRNKDTINWSSDVNISVGDFPALYGFDLVDGMSYQKEQVKKIFRQGGIITYSWHIQNPVTDGYYGDKRGDAMQNILEGKPYHNKWKAKLDEIATYFNSLEVKGIKVPILFRPFHEHTNGHFWWSDSSISNKTFREVWEFTIRYLRDECNVHNLLYVYNPTNPIKKGGLNDGKYPGNEWVDIISFDLYWGGEDVSKSILENSKAVVNFAKKNGKIAAISEAGVGQGLQNSKINNWITTCILNPLKNDSIAKEISYWLTWRNLKKNRYWVPLPSYPQHKDFMRFYNDEMTLFHSDLPNMYTNNYYCKK